MPGAAPSNDLDQLAFRAEPVISHVCANLRQGDGRPKPDCQSSHRVGVVLRAWQFAYSGFDERRNNFQVSAHPASAKWPTRCVAVTDSRYSKRLKLAPPATCPNTILAGVARVCGSIRLSARHRHVAFRGARTHRRPRGRSARGVVASTERTVRCGRTTRLNSTYSDSNTSLTAW
jgi:hypothetical protein